VFKTALGYKTFWLKRGFSSRFAGPLTDVAVFNKTKSAMGGHVRVIISGAAPLAQYVMEFLNAVMCCPIVQVRPGGFRGLEVQGSRFQG
jgi:long-chain acyl-CoA synthetase